MPPRERRPMRRRLLAAAGACLLLLSARRSGSDHLALAAAAHPSSHDVRTPTSGLGGGGGEGWRRRGRRRRYPPPPSSSTCASLPLLHARKPPSFRWTARRALFRTRGGAGGDEDEGATAVAVEAEEEAEAEAVADDGVVAGSAETDAGDASADADAAPATNTTEAEASAPPPRNLTFPATKPYDGSPDDPDGIPSRFLLMKKGDRAEAKEAFEGHLAWRSAFSVDTILARPHRRFDVCKALVPHYFSGRDPHGNVVFVQRPARLDFELMRRNGASIDDLLTHYIYVIEYCWNVLEEGPPEGVMTNVLDMRGMSFRNMKNQEYIGFGKRFVNMMSSNYPGRSYKTLVVNAPKWFHALYKVFKPMLRESTRQKIVILKPGEQQDAALRFYLGDALPEDLLSDEGAGTEAGTRYFVPTEEGGEACAPGPNSEMEFGMRQFCIEQLKLHNETLQEVN